MRYQPGGGVVWGCTLQWGPGLWQREPCGQLHPSQQLFSQTDSPRAHSHGCHKTLTVTTNFEQVLNLSFQFKQKVNQQTRTRFYLFEYISSLWSCSTLGRPGWVNPTGPTEYNLFQKSCVAEKQRNSHRTVKALIPVWLLTYDPGQVP